MRMTLALALLLAGCAQRVDVAPADAGACQPSNDPLGRPTICCPTACTEQLECWGPHAPCQEWGCPKWGPCSDQCELGPILPGGVCLSDAGLGICSEGGTCER